MSPKKNLNDKKFLPVKNDILELEMPKRYRGISPTAPIYKRLYRPSTPEQMWPKIRMCSPNRSPLDKIISPITTSITRQEGEKKIPVIVGNHVINTVLDKLLTRFDKLESEIKARFDNLESELKKFDHNTK